MRAAGKSFNQLFAGAGIHRINGFIRNLQCNADWCFDGANTSSSSFVSYRIYEQVKCYTPAGDQALVHVSATAQEQVNV